ncbi:MAG: hypothetical protein OQK56_01575 [Ignavibacteriaceae bacterium]|jgi:hypothetical protein|nr:hypothetical protein [Ignavibacteriaceae bacterium]MCW9066396.1 hypothetical protein [Ignavibacteriaceae bacterium]
MKTMLKIIFSAIVIVAAIASLVFSKFYELEKLKPSLTKEITNEYFPTDTLLKLSYNSSMGDAEAIIKQVGKNYIMDLRNDDFYFVQTVHVENDTIFLTKLDQEVDVFLFISSSSSVTYNRPYLRFPFPLSINDNWNWDGVEYIDGEDPDTISVSGKVLGEELLETEAGNFECVKFQIDIRKKKSGSHTKFYEWRTPKIGLVKLEAFIDSKGFIGTIINLLGYDEMKFELKKIG